MMQQTTTSSSHCTPWRHVFFTKESSQTATTSVFYPVHWVEDGTPCVCGEYIFRLGGNNKMFRTCPACGQKIYSAAKEQEVWECPECGGEVNKEDGDD